MRGGNEVDRTRPSFPTDRRNHRLTLRRIDYFRCVLTRTHRRRPLQDEVLEVVTARILANA
jgi:hypothetical protein